jgi:two-component sensor histidine kinase
MQVIVSLLRLQSRNISDEAMRGMFQASQSRIQAMALIHEKLYQSRDLAGVDFGAYVEVLAAYLRASSGMEASRVEVEVQVGDVRLDINRAIPCGLIINELVTNALKYAFPRGRGGRVRISISRGERGRFVLAVSDNGTGLPQDIDLEQPETLGLQIVRDLVRQLDGRLAVDRGGGTTFHIDF